MTSTTADLTEETCTEVSKEYLKKNSFWYQYRYVIPCTALASFLVRVLKFPVQLGIFIITYFILYSVVSHLSSIVDSTELDNLTNNCEEYTSRKKKLPKDFLSIVEKWDSIKKEFDEEDRLAEEEAAKAAREALADNKKDVKEGKIVKIKGKVDNDCTTFIANLRKKVTQLTTDFSACGMRKKELTDQIESNDCSGIETTVRQDLEDKFNAELKDCAKLEYSLSQPKTNSQDVLAQEALRRQRERNARSQSRADSQIERNITKSAALEKRKQELNQGIVQLQNEIDELRKLSEREIKALNNEQQRLLAEEETLEQQKILASATARAEIERKQAETRAKLAQIEQQKVKAEKDSQARIQVIAQKEEEQKKLINQKNESDLVQTIKSLNHWWYEGESHTECPKLCKTKGLSWYNKQVTYVKDDNASHYSKTYPQCDCY